MDAPIVEGSLAFLPVGAVEAHGPHLPLDTDTRIATLVAERAAAILASSRKGTFFVAPPFTETAASFAADFAGTLDVDREVEERGLALAIGSLLVAGVERVAIVNLHFDPVHVAALKRAVARAAAERPGRVLHPEFTRRAHVAEIGGEFATGTCHAGEFETSLMLVAAPALVDASFASLPSIEVDLARAIREGKRSFRELGLDRAYCGHPATSSVTEGERLADTLARIVARACDERQLP